MAVLNGEGGQSRLDGKGDVIARRATFPSSFRLVSRRAMGEGPPDIGGGLVPRHSIPLLGGGGEGVVLTLVPEKGRLEAVAS